MEYEPTNFNICPSCGTEFGLNDVNASVADLRQAWIEEGAKWWSQSDPIPQHWNPFVQLSRVAPQLTARLRPDFREQLYAFRQTYSGSKNGHNFLSQYKIPSMMACGSNSRLDEVVAA